MATVPLLVAVPAYDAPSIGTGIPSCTGESDTPTIVPATAPVDEMAVPEAESRAVIPLPEASLPASGLTAPRTPGLPTPVPPLPIRLAPPVLFLVVPDWGNDESR